MQVSKIMKEHMVYPEILLVKQRAMDCVDILNAISDTHQDECSSSVRGCVRVPKL